MNSEDRTSSILNRLMGLGWFFVCLFGANAALGVCLVLLGSDAATQLWIGFQGGMAALIGIGGLQLAQAFLDKGLSTLERITKAAVFASCLCGAAVALGIYLFVFMDRPGMATFLEYSLLAAAAALFVTGFLKLGETYTMTTSGNVSSDS